jgi:broad specificity phosphatase PhoE
MTGETEWSKTGQHTSTTEVELTSHGITQARDLSRFVFENQCQGNVYFLQSFYILNFLN